MKKLLSLTALAVLSAGMVTPAMADWDIFERGEVHVAGLYMKPSNNGLEVGSTQISGAPISIPGGVTPPLNNLLTSVFDEDIVSLEPRFRWNYALGFSYLFCGTQTRMFFDYEYFQDHASISGAGVSNGFLFEMGDLYSRVDVKHNMFRTGLSRLVPVGPQFSVDLSAFFEYNRLYQKTIENDLNSTTLLAQIVGTNVSFDSYVSSLNKMHGFGPGVGFKILGAPNACCPQFKLFGGIMASILWADQSGDFEQDIIAFIPNGSASPPTITAEIPFMIQPHGGKALVSKFDIDLGIDYSHKVCVDSAKMLLGVTVGVRYVNLINALKYTNYTALPILNQSSNFQPVDWGRAGPYIQFKLGGAES